MKKSIIIIATSLLLSGCGPPTQDVPVGTTVSHSTVTRLNECEIGITFDITYKALKVRIASEECDLLRPVQ